MQTACHSAHAVHRPSPTDGRPRARSLTRRTPMRIRFMTALVFVTAIAFAGHAEMGRADTQQFFEKAASSNQFEIESGRLAAQKASSPQLKAFGQKMVADH